MDKLIFSLVALLSYNFCLEARTNDTINSSHIFILGIKKFNDPVCFYRKESYKKIPHKDMFVIVEKEKIKNFTIKRGNFIYAQLDSNCYVTESWSSNIASFVHKYVIPIAEDKYVAILKNTYPKPVGHGKIFRSIYDATRIKYGKNYSYSHILHKKFLVILIPTTLYNSSLKDILPPRGRFQGDKAEQGIYLKLLIPVLDDEVN